MTTKTETGGLKCSAVPPVRAVLLLLLCCCCGTSVRVRSNSLLARQLTKTAFGFFEFKVVGVFVVCFVFCFGN